MPVKSSNVQYLNPYQQAHAELQHSNFYDATKWDKFAKEGELPAYINTLIDADEKIDANKFNREWAFASEDTKFDALVNELYADRTKVKDNTFVYYDKYNQRHEDVFQGTDYEFNKKVLTQNLQVDLARKNAADIEAEKAKMSDVQRFFNDIWGGIKEVGVGALEEFAGILQVANQIITGIPATAISALMGDNIDYVRKASDYTPGEEYTWWNWYNKITDDVKLELAEWEMRYSNLRDGSGNLTNSGRTIVSMSNSFGQMIPSMVMHFIPGVRLAGNTAYWAGMAGRDIHEMVQQYAPNQMSTMEIVSNAAISTAMEWAVSEALSKYFGASLKDHLLYNHALTKATEPYTIRTMLTRVGMDALREGAEEVLQDYGAWFLDRVYGLGNKNFLNNSELTLQSTWDAFSLGALSSLILGAGSIAIHSGIDVQKRVDYKRTKQGKIKTYSKFDIQFGREIKGFKRDSDGTILLDKNGKPKYDHFGFLKSAALRMTKADIQEYLNELYKENNHTGVVTAYEMARMLADAYGELGQYRFEQAVKVLRQMADITTAVDILTESTTKTVTTKEANKKSKQKSRTYTPKFVTINDPLTHETLKLNDQSLANQVWFITSFLGRKVDMKTFKAITKNGMKILKQDSQNREEREKVRKILEKEKNVNTVVASSDADHVIVTEIAPAAKLSPQELEEFTHEMDELFGSVRFPKTDIKEKEQKVVIVPEGMSPEEVEADLDDRQLVNQVLDELTQDSPGNKLFVDWLVTTIRKITSNDNITSVEAIYIALFDKEIYHDIVFQSPYQVIQLLSKIDQAIHESDDLSDAGRFRYAKTIAEHARVLIDYARLQPDFDTAKLIELTNRGIITTDDLKKLQRNRYSFKIAEKILDGTVVFNDLTIAEQTIIQERINNTTWTAIKKHEILTKLSSPDEQVRTDAMFEISRYYHGLFMGPFNGFIYPKLDTEQNRIFAAWLIKHEYTLEVPIDSTTIISMQQEGLNPLSVNDYHQFLTKKFEADYPNLSVITEYIGKTHQPTLRVIDNAQMNKKIKLNKWKNPDKYDFMLRDTSNVVTTLSKYNLDISDFLKSNLSDTTKNTLTINDIIYSPELLNDDILKSIRSRYNLSNNEEFSPAFIATFINSMLLENSDGKLGIILLPDYTYALSDVSQAVNLLKRKADGTPVFDSNIKGRVPLSTFINSDFIEGSLLETCQVEFTDKIPNLSETYAGAYDSSKNLIQIVRPNPGERALKAKINYGKDFTDLELQFTFLHEVQHVIQTQNNMIEGTNTTVLRYLSPSKVTELLNDMRTHYPGEFKGDDQADLSKLTAIIYTSTLGEMSAFFYYNSEDYLSASEFNNQVILPMIFKMDPEGFRLITWWGAVYKIPVISTRAFSQKPESIINDHQSAYSKNTELAKAAEDADSVFNIFVDETATEFDGKTAEIILIDRDGNVLGGVTDSFAQYMKDSDMTTIMPKLTYLASAIQVNLVTNEITLPDKISKVQYAAYEEIIHNRYKATNKAFDLNEYQYVLPETDKPSWFSIPKKNIEQSFNYDTRTTDTNVILHRSDSQTDLSVSEVLNSAAERQVDFADDVSVLPKTPDDTKATKIPRDTKRKRITTTDVDENPKFKPFKDRRHLLSDEMKKFINEVDYARIDPYIREKLVDGTLTWQDVVRYIRETDVDDMNDYTFDILCKTLFPNIESLSKKEVSWIVDNEAIIFAIGYAFSHTENSGDLLDTTTNISNLIEVANNLSDPLNNSELAKNYRLALNKFPGGATDQLFAEIAAAEQYAAEHPNDKDAQKALKDIQKAQKKRLRAAIDTQKEYDKGHALMISLRVYDGTIRTLYAASVKLLNEVRNRYNENESLDAPRKDKEGSEEESAQRDVIEERADFNPDAALIEKEDKEESGDFEIKELEDWIIENPDLVEDEDTFLQILVKNTPTTDKIREVMRYQLDVAFIKVRKSKKKVDSDKIFDIKKKLLKKYTEMSEIELNKEYIKAVTAFVYGNLKGLDSARLEMLATNVRNREKVIANIKGRASILLRHLSPKEREVFYTLHPGIFDENENLDPKNYVDKPIEELYELEDKLQSWARLAREDKAYATQQNAKRFEKLEKENNALREALEKERKKRVRVKEEKIGTKTVKIMYVAIDDGFEVGSDRPMPPKLREMLAIGFKRMRKSHVEYLSENDSAHPVVSRNDFLESCSEILANLSQTDVNEIVDYLCNAVTLNQIDDDYRKYQTYKIFILAYFERMAALNQIELTDTQLVQINKSVENIVGISAQVTKAWMQSMNDMNPINHILKTFAKKYDLELDEVTVNDYIKALMTGNPEKVKAAQAKMIDRIIQAYKYRYSRFEVYRFDKDHVKPHGFDNKVKNTPPAFRRAALIEAGAVKHLVSYSQLSATEKTYAIEKPLTSSRRTQLFSNIFNFQRMAMLSSPGTWLRNISSNWIVRGSNIAADKIGNWTVDLWNKLSKKHKYKHRESQYTLQGKASQDATDFVTSMKTTRFLTLLFNGANKYETNLRRGEHTGDTDLGQLLTMIVVNHFTQEYTERHLFGTNAKTKFGQKIQKATNALNYGITWMLSDDTRFRIVTQTALGYIRKMLTEDGYSYHNENQMKNLNNFQIDLLKLVMGDGKPADYQGIKDVLGKTDEASVIDRKVTQNVLNIFAEGYKFALHDYMHRSNFWNETVEPAMKSRLSPEVFWLYKQVFPFMSASWNWFVEGLNYTPIGIVRGAIDLWRIDARIEKLDKDRQQGKNQISSRFAEVLAKRTLGKGIMGSIILGAFTLLGALGLARLDDRDDKIKMWIGDVGVDVTELFGVGPNASVGMLLGMMFTDKYYGTWNQGLAEVAESFLMESTFADIADMLRYGLGNYLTDSLPSSIMNSFILNGWRFLMGITYNTKVKYSSGIKGMFERLWVNIGGGAAIAIANMPVKIDPYTGKPLKKYKIPVINDFVNRLLPVKFYEYEISDAEKLAVTLGMHKSQLTGNYDDIGQLSDKDVATLNQKYGELNNKALSDFLNNLTKYRVKMENGTFKELTYQQMSSKQIANVIDSIMKHNASLAKIMVWTEKGHKYYGSQSIFEELKSLGYRQGVYVKTKQKDGFIT